MPAKVKEPARQTAAEKLEAAKRRLTSETGKLTALRNDAMRLNAEISQAIRSDVLGVTVAVDLDELHSEFNKVQDQVRMQERLIETLNQAIGGELRKSALSEKKETAEIELRRLRAESQKAGESVKLAYNRLCDELNAARMIAAKHGHELQSYAEEYRQLYGRDDALAYLPDSLNLVFDPFSQAEHGISYKVRQSFNPYSAIFEPKKI